MEHERAREREQPQVSDQASEAWRRTLPDEVQPRISRKLLEKGLCLLTSSHFFISASSSSYSWRTSNTNHDPTNESERLRFDERSIRAVRTERLGSLCTGGRLG